MAEFASFAGPGVINFNPNAKGAYDYYTDPSGIKLTYERGIFTPETASWGAMGDRHTGTKTKISFTPAGHLTAALLTRFWPYSMLDVGKLCRSVLGAPLIVIPNPANGSQQLTFSKACITRLPPLKLSANSLSFGGPMEIQCWGDAAKAQADASYWATLATAVAPSTTTVAMTEFPSPRVTVTHNSKTWEVNDDGITIDFQLTVGNDLMVNSYGPQDAIIKSMKILASFTPVSEVASTLTEAEYHTALLLDNTGAKRPGDYVGTANDLVIACTGDSASMASLTLASMGPGSGGLEYSVDRWRQGQMTFHSKPVFTAGAPIAMFTAA